MRLDWQPLLGSVGDLASKYKAERLKKTLSVIHPPHTHMSLLMLPDILSSQSPTKALRVLVGEIFPNGRTPLQVKPLHLLLSHTLTPRHQLDPSTLRVSPTLSTEFTNTLSSMSASMTVDISVSYSSSKNSTQLPRTKSVIFQGSDQIREGFPCCS